MPALPVGKLPPQLLQRLLNAHASVDPRVVVGPQVGEDAAVLDIGDRYLVATADPVTFATDELGWYALHVNANDLAVRGARPLWFLATVLLPDGGTTELGVERLFPELREAWAELGVGLVGGHTEVTAGLPRPIVSGCILGEVEKDRLVTTGGARPGDTLLLTKGVPLEGAAIVARERAAEAGRRGVAADVVKRAQDFLRRPGISVVPEARAACAAARVHAMHDPTEGGVATACWGLAQAAGVDVLRSGGNVVDAAIATNAVLAVTQPNYCGVGGDIFVLYHEAATRRVHFLNGAGRSGSRATLDELGRRGLKAVPGTGAGSVSVPGVTRGWRMLLDRFGTRPLGSLLEPAAYYADEGFPLSDVVAQAIREKAPSVDDPEWHRVFVPGGAFPRTGDCFRQPELARTLAELGQEPELFYKGRGARSIAERLSRDGFLTPEAPAAH